VLWLAAEYDKDDKAKQLLREALDSRYRKVRNRAALELANKKDAAAFDSLVQLLHEMHEPAKQKRLIQALVTLGDPRAPDAFLDRIENDIDRLRRLNAVLAAGARRFGPDFARSLNEELVRIGQSALRPLDVVYVRASQDIGVLAAEYVRSQEFAKRARGFVGRMLRRFGEGEREADLLSYVLFDGPFAGRLVELGRCDARARHDELVAFFAKRLGES